MNPSATWQSFQDKVIRRQWPIISVFLIFVGAFGLVAAGFWRRGALLIGIGLALGGWFVGAGFVKSRLGVRSVTVKGLAERDVRADLALWPLRFVATGNVLADVRAKIVADEAAVRAYYDRMMKGDRPVVRSVTADPKVLGRRLGSDWSVSWGNLNDHFILSDGTDLPFNSVFTITAANGDELTASYDGYGVPDPARSKSTRLNSSH